MIRHQRLTTIGGRPAINRRTFCGIAAGTLASFATAGGCHTPEAQQQLPSALNSDGRIHARPRPRADKFRNGDQGARTRPRPRCDPPVADQAFCSSASFAGASARRRRERRRSAPAPRLVRGRGRDRRAGTRLARVQLGRDPGRSRARRGFSEPRARASVRDGCDGSSAPVHRWIFRWCDLRRLAWTHQRRSVSARRRVLARLRHPWCDARQAAYSSSRTVPQTRSFRSIAAVA